MSYPSPAKSSRAMLASSAKWGGRSTAILLLLLWGAFFVEHTSEWILRAGGHYPPTSVWLRHLAHFAVLVGLGLMLKWERLGGLILIVATVAFFGTIGMHRFPFIALINLVPIALFCVSWIAAKPADT